MRARFLAVGFVTTMNILGGPAAVCAECPGSEIPYPAGMPDEFALPTEPTYPSPEYVAYMAEFWPGVATRLFDAPGNDDALIHTFAGWVGPVCGARLEIRLAAQTSELSYNDSVRFDLIGGPDPVHCFRYWTTIRSVLGSWGPGSVATLDLDLADLPPFEDFPTNILDALSDGALELAVEDDTAVDFATLYVCSCTVPVEPASWGQIKAQYGEADNP